ncbi:MAG: hypothetical protein ACPGD5_03580 [Salibacteraceae bacterium]
MIKVLKYSFIFTSLSLFICQNAISQADSNRHARNVIFIEAGGFGGFGSINYERVFIDINKFSFSSRLGIGTYHFVDYTNSFNPDIIIPVTINALYGRNHKIEAGIGQTFSSIVKMNFSDAKTKRSTNFHTVLSLGYRYQKETGGLFFRATYTPLLEFNKYYTHWAGISIGYSF